MRTVILYGKRVFDVAQRTLHWRHAQEEYKTTTCIILMGIYCDRVRNDIARRMGDSLWSKTCLSLLLKEEYLV